MTNPDEYRIHSDHNQHVEGPNFFARAGGALDARLFLERIQALATEVQRTKHSYSIFVDNQRRQILTTCKERDEALDQVKALQDEVNRLEAELQTERHKRSCTSSEPAHMAELEAAAPAAPEDGGPYRVICEQIVGNEIRSNEGVLTQNPASFAAVGFAPNEAEAFCNRLNLERDRRIKAERGHYKLRARVADLEGDKRDAAYFQECLKAEETAHRLCFRKMKDLEEQARKGMLSTGPAQILPSGLQVTPVSDGLDMEKALVKVVDIEAMLDQIKARCSAAHYAASCLRDTIEQGGAE